MFDAAKLLWIIDSTNVGAYNRLTQQRAESFGRNVCFKRYEPNIRIVPSRSEKTVLPRQKDK